VKDLSRSARLYIIVTLVAGMIIGAWNLAHLNSQDAWLLLVVSAVAAAAQVLKVEGATHRSSYNISWVAYAFALVRLGAPAAMFVILVSHLVEWIFHKYPWYIQLFNIATYLVAAQAAQFWLGPSISSFAPLPLVQALAILGAMAVFTAVNHLLIGIVIWLARGESLMKSGVFGTLTLMIDFSLLCVGTGAALVWTINPFAVAAVVIPLYLIYSTLRVPALERQTDTDPKTGLYNARYLKDALEKELAKAKRFERPLTVVMSDLDLMRTINNTYGHLAGDAVLNGIAEILKQSVRTYDVVARFGGEEFVILMPEVGPEEAVARVDIIRRTVEGCAFQVATDIQPIRATMSFGVAGYEHPDQTGEHILHNADLAVYYSKLNGRNRVALHFKGQSRVTGETRQDAETAPGAEAAPPYSPPAPGVVSTQPPPRVEAGAVAQAQTPGAQTAQAAPAGAEAGNGAPSAAAATKPAVATPAPPWLVNSYIGGLALVALAFITVTLGQPPMTDSFWMGLAIFAGLALLTEGLAVDIYVRNTSVSLATVPLVAAVWLLGAPGAIVVSCVLAFTAKVKHQSPMRHFVFNLSNHLIGSLGCLLLLRLTGRAIADYGLGTQLVLVTLSALVIFVSTTALVALVIRLDTGRPWRQTWPERFSWLWPYYVAMGVIAYMVIYSYTAVGLLGVGAVIVPLAVLRYSQQLYINRTRAMVQQLRAANDTLLKQAKEVATLNEELLLALAHAIDLRDPDVLGHSHNVARYAVLIAQELNLPPEKVELVRKGGLLHDIGKLGIPEAIVFKPGALNSEEYARMKQHSVLGADIIAECHSLYDLVTIVRHHHERYDGGGYPDHLQAHDIPLEARIMAVADSVEAMASDRPYREAMDSMAILEEVQSQAGAQFDPYVTTALWNVVRKSPTPVIINSARRTGAGAGQPPAPTPGPAVHQAEPIRIPRQGPGDK
jgi:diguanylate cyclase (GGDEF)-like protein/putative nucleotidyltransferase with HDIG domain